MVVWLGWTAYRSIQIQISLSKEEEMKKLTKRLPLLLIMLMAAGFAWGGGQQGVEVEGPGMEMVETRFNEAPVLAALVAAGDLPPVDDRVPENPYVVEIIDSIGKYGGELNVFATGPGDWGDLHNIMQWDGLLRIPRNGVGVEPELAESFEINDDATVTTIPLRKGLKWSDGHPLTSEDIRFMYDDIVNYVTATGEKGTVRNWGSLPQFKEMGVVDEQTIHMITWTGLGTGVLEMGGWQGTRIQCFQASHYLKPYHIRYNPDANKLAAEEGYDRWQDAMRSHYFWGDVQKDFNTPKVKPWVLKQRGDTSRVFERNPFYHAVDPAGNQLPYIDRLVVQEVNAEVYQLKASSGDADMAYGGLKVDNLSLYKSNEGTGDFHTVLYPGTMSSAWTLVLNTSYGDPGSIERSIWTNIKFRAALSVAINRDEVNDILAFGLGVPGQASVLPETSYYQEGWKEYYAAYDPAQANRLLDEVGLSKKDGAGFRLGPDGKPVTIILEYDNERGTTYLELVKEYWEDVGIKTIIKLQDVGLLDERRGAGLVMVWFHGGLSFPPSDERSAFTALWQWGNMNGPRVGLWERSKGDAIREITGEQELPENWPYFDTPDFDKEWVEERNMELPNDQWKDTLILNGKWRRSEMGTPEYEDLGRQIMGAHIERLDFIGSVGRLPQAMIVKNGLKNFIVPDFVNGQSMGAFLVQRWSAPQLWWDREDRR
jgi:peptide/nickel transport system substrate-binding protein